MSAAKVGQVVSVLGLARAAGEGGAAPPGRRWVTARIEGKTHWQLTSRRWLIALEGDLLIDLPHRDFRIVRRGEALELPAELELDLQPIGEAAAILWHDD
jgi:hypothetical protein